MTANQAEELALFSSLAETWWDPSGPMKPLHLLNPIRLDFIKQHVDLQQQQVLDVGCGAGLLSEALAKQGAKVTALELSDAVIQVAQEHASEANLPIDYHCQSVQDYAQQSKKTFAAITCMELLEHVEDPKALLKACYDLLDDGGYIFLSTINRTAKAFLKTIVGAEYLLNILPKGTHHYRQFIKPSELAAWLREVGFIVGDRQGIDINLTDNYQLSDDVSTNYLMLARK